MPKAFLARAAGARVPGGSGGMLRHQFLSKTFLNISGMKDDLSKRKVPFLLALKGVSNKQT